MAALRRNSARKDADFPCNIGGGAIKSIACSAPRRRLPLSLESKQRLQQTQAGRRLMSRDQQVKVSLHIILAAFALGAAGTAAAGETGSVVGATILYRLSNGLETRTDIHRDGTFVSRASNGMKSSGNWKRQGKNLCLTQLNPPAPEDFRTVCSPFAERRLGESWTEKGAMGGTAQISIVQTR